MRQIGNIDITSRDLSVRVYEYGAHFAGSVENAANLEVHEFHLGREGLHLTRVELLLLGVERIPGGD